MIVDDINYDSGGRLLRLQATAVSESVPGVRLQPWFDVPHEAGAIAPYGGPFAAGLLPTCMFQGERLRVEGPVSRALLSGIEVVQDILCSWYPALQRVEVSAAKVLDVSGHPLGVGAFFSAGVDAWYTLLKHQEEVSHLIMVRGFDIPVDGKQGIWDETINQIDGIAKAMNKRLFEVQTNIRAVGDMRWGKWGRHYDTDFWGECMHGAALAAVGLTMQQVLGKMYIGATYSEDYMAPWGSHPQLDHHWSTRIIEFVHDGAEANRMDKIRRIALEPLALSSLRVCFENRDARYNCCVCEKCCRTMMALRACGALERASAFPLPLDLLHVRKRLYDAHHLPWYRAILPAAIESGDRELIDALRIVLGEKFSFDQVRAKFNQRVHNGIASVRRLARPLKSIRRRNDGSPIAA